MVVIISCESSLFWTEITAHGGTITWAENILLHIPDDKHSPLCYVTVPSHSSFWHWGHLQWSVSGVILFCSSCKHALRCGSFRLIIVAYFVSEVSTYSVLVTGEECRWPRPAPDPVSLTAVLFNAYSLWVCVVMFKNGLKSLESILLNNLCTFLH